MEEQVFNVERNHFKDKIEKIISNYRDIGFFFMFWSVIYMIILVMFSLFATNFIKEIFSVGMVVFVPMAITSIYNYDKSKSCSKCLEDFEKNIYFLQNKKDINSKSLSKSIKKEDSMLNVNNISKLSLDELKNIKENIEKIKNDEEHYEIEDSLSKSLKLTKK